MKYQYKDTGVVVESDRVLDSTTFMPITEQTPEAPKEPKTEKKAKRGK